MHAQMLERSKLDLMVRRRSGVKYLGDSASTCTSFLGPLSVGQPLNEIELLVVGFGATERIC